MNHAPGCTELMRVEPREVREARRARMNLRNRDITRQIHDAPRMQMRTWWDPADTGYESGEPRIWWGPRRWTWLVNRDFFISDGVLREEPCHMYCRVRSGTICHKCGGATVSARGGGVACPCEHTWFCW